MLTKCLSTSACGFPVDTCIHCNWGEPHINSTSMRELCVVVHGGVVGGGTFVRRYVRFWYPEPVKK